MKNQINYLMSGPAHLPYLLVSLYTLRFHYDGEVMVHAWPESFPIVEEIAKDQRLSITTREREPAYRGRNCQFIDKIRMIQSLEGEVNVAAYIDADTTFHNKFGHIFFVAAKYGFVATQWNDWHTQYRSIQRRIKWLEPFVESGDIDREVYEDTLRNQYASVNGGVWAAKPESPVLKLWEQWTWAARKDIFIADEVVLHTMYPQFGPTNQMGIMVGGSYNCSPKYKPENLKIEDIRIMHYHGDSNVRPDKSEYGYRAWWPIWQSCIADNVGNVQSWKDKINNKWIKKLENR